MDLPFRPLLPPNTAAAPNLRSPFGANLSGQDRALLDQAKALEASFLSEMLGHAGLGESPDSFNGGIGEEQFSSFLRAEQAKAMVDQGGIGLAEQIFNALKERVSDAN